MGKVYTATSILKTKVATQSGFDFQQKSKSKTNFIAVFLKFYTILKIVPYSCFWVSEEAAFYLKTTAFRKVSYL